MAALASYVYILCQWKEWFVNPFTNWQQFFGTTLFAYFRKRKMVSAFIAWTIYPCENTAVLLTALYESVLEQICQGTHF